MGTLLVSQTPPGRWDYVKPETVQGAPTPWKDDGCEQQEKNSGFFLASISTA